MADQLIVIGTSLGGLNALEVILAQLPADFSLAIAIVQHRHHSSDRELVTFMQHTCPLPLCEAEDKQAIAPGQIYLAPANYHLLVEPGYFTLSTEAPVLYARPAIDLALESAANAYGSRAIGVILTGASQDGAEGLARLAQAGGMAIVQDPTSADSPTMPTAALAAVPTALVLPLEKIGPHLIHLSRCPIPH